MTDTPAAPATAEAIYAEHRKCGPKYEGCYSHFTFMDHCRADGMAWPCDVAQLAASRTTLAEPRWETFTDGDGDGGVRRAPPAEALDATEIAAMALHRWKHPSFDLDDYRCRCRDDAEMAVRLLSPRNEA